MNSSGFVYNVIQTDFSIMHLELIIYFHLMMKDSIFQLLNLTKSQEIKIGILLQQNEYASELNLI
jgi:hypothetical protein